MELRSRADTHVEGVWLDTDWEATRPRPAELLRTVPTRGICSGTPRPLRAAATPENAITQIPDIDTTHAAQNTTHAAQNIKEIREKYEKQNKI